MKKLLLSMLLLLISNNSIGQNRIYVNQAATGTNTGDSWANAYTSLVHALGYVPVGGAEVWVAKGTYKPDASNRSLDFRIFNNHTKLYGGFAGNEAN